MSENTEVTQMETHTQKNGVKIQSTYPASVIPASLERWPKNQEPSHTMAAILISDYAAKF